MNDAAFNQLLDTALRRKLTAEEGDQLQACLARDPQARAVWEEEMALSQLLNRLPDAPLASNFTAQVLQAVERNSLRQPHALKLFRRFGLRRPAQRVAAACLAVIIATIGYGQYQSARRERMALALHKLAPHFDSPSQAVALTPDELWNDFDAINRLPPQADEALLAVLKEVAMK